MNYFAHGRPFVDDPYFLAGTAVPDWLNVVDRRARVRSVQARLHVDSPDPRVARLAAGIVQHVEDDQWFHGTRAFAELSLELCQLFRERLPADDGFRPHFLGHILVEILLDAALIEENPARLDAYYAAIDGLDPHEVERSVATIGGAPVANLATFVGLFARERFLSDYADDAKLLFRLNQVMRRVGLSVLPAATVNVLAQARAMVTPRAQELLDHQP
jgi:hypothetical protein